MGCIKWGSTVHGFPSRCKAWLCTSRADVRQMRIFRNFHPKNRVSRPRFSAEHDAAIENLRNVKEKPENLILCEKSQIPPKLPLWRPFSTRRHGPRFLRTADFEITRWILLNAKGIRRINWKQFFYPPMLLRDSTTCHMLSATSLFNNVVGYTGNFAQFLRTNASVVYPGFPARGFTNVLTQKEPNF